MGRSNIWHNARIRVFDEQLAKEAERVPDNPYEATRFTLSDPRELDWKDQKSRILTLQIIVFALVNGVLIFAGIAYFQAENPMRILWDSMTISGIIGAAAAAVGSWIIPPILISSQVAEICRDADSDVAARASQLFDAYQVQTIIAGAILEGAAFFNLILLMLDKGAVPLLAAAVCVILLASKFPTRTRVLHWVAFQLN